MRKGQLGDLSNLAWGVMLLGIILILASVIITGFQSSSGVAGTRILGAANLNLYNDTLLTTGTGPAVNQSHYILYSVANHDSFIAGNLTTTTVSNNSVGTGNYTVWVNSVLVGNTYGYNTTSTTIQLTAGQLVNNKNNVTYLHPVGWNITNSSMWFAYQQVVFSTPGSTVANNTAIAVLGGFSIMSGYIGLIVTIGIMAFLVGLVLLLFGGRIGGEPKRYE
jgi:hypothetical protein